MKDYPKHLNTKADYLYVKDNFPKSMWEQDFQNLLDTQYDWVITSELNSKEDGIEDDTHKIIEMQEMQSDIKYYQSELKDIETAPIHQMNFTVKEVKKILSAK